MKTVMILLIAYGVLAIAGTYSVTGPTEAKKRSLAYKIGVNIGLWCSQEGRLHTPACDKWLHNITGLQAINTLRPY